MARPLRSAAGEGARLFLKSLTLKGFKSFADKTTLEFEPGVCVVVGPERLGQVEHRRLGRVGARRPGCAGAARRQDGRRHLRRAPPTGPRSGGPRSRSRSTTPRSLLPIEFSEVTITRTLFRTGESEYMINGVAVPAARHPGAALRHGHRPPAARDRRPGSARRGAQRARPRIGGRSSRRPPGILKFRKRKEKAERRLEATEGNLLRLTDLLREVRRQLRPLERQADAARRHDGIVAELRADPPAPRRPRDRAAARARAASAPSARGDARAAKNRTCACGCARSTPR